MKTIDILAAAQPYRSSPIFTAATLPQRLQREHRTKAGVWARIRILAGALQYDPMDGTPPYLLTPTRWVTVAPQEALRPARRARRASDRFLRSTAAGRCQTDL